jgi:hypothetical protein
MASKAGVVMAEQCFIKTASKPPVCGVHNVVLVEHEACRERFLGGIGNFSYLVCPVSDQVPKASLRNRTEYSDQDDQVRD